MDNWNANPMILKRRLKSIGLSDAAVNAAWPTWWSEAAEASPSAMAELRFSLARKLGLDPRSLLNDNEVPRFVWRDEARFKHIATEDEQELAAISSFGKALAVALIAATPSGGGAKLPGAQELRKMLLKTREFIKLSDLLSIAWSVSIPVVHLQVFPCERKRMAAMAIQVGQRDAILLGKDSDYPAHIAFYLAHEIGHIVLGHLREGQVLVDMDSTLATSQSDREENEADRFALELLTGDPEPHVLPLARRYTARQLAYDTLREAPRLRIEPGTLALCFGYSTGNWATASAAMRGIYTNSKPVWTEVNLVAQTELDFDQVSNDTSSYISAILGNPQPL